MTSLDLQAVLGFRGLGFTGLRFRGLGFRGIPQSYEVLRLEGLLVPDRAWIVKQFLPSMRRGQPSRSLQ